MATKTTKKKVVKKTTKKSTTRSANTTHEIVVRIAPQQSEVPTITDLSEPLKDGKKLTIPKTFLSDKQILKMVERTPARFVYKRKGKGGQMWDYVTGSYVEKVLNYTFGFMWDFDVIAHGITGDHIWVQGKLTVYNEDGTRSIHKTQFGRKEVAYTKGSAHKPENMLDFGNDLKAATTDALKKCASMFGIASDIYGKAEYKQETGTAPRETEQQQSHEEPTIQIAATAQQLQQGQIIGPHGEPTFVCSKCKEPISDQVATYSKQVHGKRLCRDCQPKKK